MSTSIVIRLPTAEREWIRRLEVLTQSTDHPMTAAEIIQSMTHDIMVDDMRAHMDWPYTDTRH